MKTLFKILATRLREQLDVVNTIDLWNNQLSNSDRQPGDFHKSIFIEFIVDEIQSGGNLVQHMPATIRVHITQQAYVDTTNGGKDDAGYNPFTVLEYIDAVHAALQGFSAIYIFKDAANEEVKNKICTSMQRMAITQDTDHGALHHWIMDYATQISDYQAQRTRNYVEITPVVMTVEKVPEFPVDRIG